MPFDLERVARDKKAESGEDYLTVNSKGAGPAPRLDGGEVPSANRCRGKHTYAARGTALSAENLSARLLQPR